MVVIISFGLSFGGAVQAAILGQTVTNTASVSYDVQGDDRVTVLTNPASFVVEAARTESTIEFFRFSPNAPDALSVQINGSDFSPSGDLVGPFVSVGAAQRKNGSSEIDISGPIPLIPATTYQTGELMFVRVADAGQNGNPAAVETVVIVVQTSNGDTVTLRLYESGPDTGEFWAYVPSNRDTTPVNDASLTTQQGTTLTATYVDSFDASEVSVDTALVDPYGRVFNGFTGELIDNARVTLIDASTGQPADVFGIDGFSRYPNSVLTGQDVTDEGGLVYDIRPGEFRFPLARLGDYFVTVEPPEGLSFASRLTAADFISLNNAPFVILNDASYGQTFTLAGTAPLNFDIPLDAETDFVLSKSAFPASGDIGDFITYTVSAQNNGQAGAPLVLTDTLPRGFKYVAGSTKLGAQSVAEPTISADGRTISFELGPLNVNASMELTYVLEIGAGAVRGDAVNSIVAMDVNGINISNIARANVTIREDLFRENSTVVGRITEKSCDGDEDWVRRIFQGEGVKGVRLYMETGAYAISDEDGLYHFEGVTPGTHVVQIDEETLPEGYTPMVCEENSRYAGSAISKFVEVQGGGLWRANFYLKKTGEVAAKEDAVLFNDLTEYKDYDSEWLDGQTADTDWVYPLASRTPSSPSINVGIKHGPDEKVFLHRNGKIVPRTNFEARDSNSTRTVMMSRWRGVDLLEGQNAFEAEILSLRGKHIRTIKRDIYFVKTIARATPLPDQSVLVADGRTKPELAIRLEDEAGRPVHKGRIAKIDVHAPYRLNNKARLEGEEELVAPGAGTASIVAGLDGIARVVLEPTLQTGKVTIVVTLDDGREITMFMYLEPEKRDWIIVGLAEGSLAYNSLKNESVALSNGAADGLNSDGRVAFFAKGLIKGDWMLTLAVDTDKRRGDRDGDFETHIDPNAYYTLYGDRSYTEYEAASRYPVYIKIEKKSFYAMFGDFNTNITEGKLTHYNRNLSGFKAEYLGAAFQATAFAAETNQGFTKDELAANGTSGPYQLRNAPVIANSETITIETRDRVRADRVVAERRLIRHLDYTLNNLTGEIIFRLPVDVSDSGFNPNVIVVDYESAGDSERNLTFGGRVQKQLSGGRVQIGSTFVHEGGNANNAGGVADMIGAEIIAQLRPGTEVRAEYAFSSSKGANTPRRSASAYLAEIVHTSAKFTADAYVRQEDAGYGLRQTSSATAGTRRYGGNLSYKFQEFENKKTGRRGSRSVTASAYREDSLGTGNHRTSSEVTVAQEGDIFSASVGLRGVQDNIAGSTRESLLAVVSASYRLPKHGLTIQASREQPLGGNDGVDDFPARTRLSLDKTITEKASVRITHDILDGENTGGQNTSVGVTYAPWAGTSITAGSDMITSDSGRRIGATIGLDQQFQINEKWSASAGISNRRVLSQSGTLTQVSPDAALSGFETNDGFTAAYLGLGYRTAKTSISGRLEAREAGSLNDYTTSFAAARELSETMSFAGAVRANWKEQNAVGGAGINAGNSNSIDGRLGMAWRPRDEDLILLNRFDVNYENTPDGQRTTKLVNNFTANSQVTDRWQLAGHYGIKYVSTDVGGADYSSVTHLLGGETRFDLTEHIDVGLNGSMLLAQDSTQYAYGPSIGVSPIDNVWLSLGYNIIGYKDEDFAAAEYSQQGVYVKFRFKFDQNSARGLLDIISPADK